jgi:hypothetical protein
MVVQVSIFPLTSSTQVCISSKSSFLCQFSSSGRFTVATMADEATSHVIEDINSTSRPKRSRDDQEEPDVSAGASKLPKFAEQDGIKVNPNSKASSA